MAKYIIEWEKIEVGTSEIEAKDLYEAEDNAESSVEDFGDPKQFTQMYDLDSGWKVKSIIEK